MKKYFLIYMVIILCALVIGGGIASAKGITGHIYSLKATAGNWTDDTEYLFIPVVQNRSDAEAWNVSGHADVSAEAFNHWNNEVPPEIPTSCAKCHSTPGFRDFLGEDGTAPWVVDNPAPVGTTIECAACHNPTAETLTDVTFPSGLSVAGLEREAVCAQCHQGRASTFSIEDAIDPADLDSVDPGLGFINIHYYPAAAVSYGNQAKPGYEYPDRLYDARFEHYLGMDSCVDCHEKHTLDLKMAKCRNCHSGVTSLDDLEDIRMAGSLRDYDGDGNRTEGIAMEINGLRNLFYSAIRAYAAEVAGTAIAYTADVYPYFFVDGNNNGIVDPAEADPNNSYNSHWTGRLLAAAYNYQLSAKETGGYAHGGKYIIELVYDGIEDLNTALTTPIDLSMTHRVDAGHFNASDYPWRNWDGDGVVPANCSRCHTSTGLSSFQDTGGFVDTPPSSGMQCTTCHTDLATHTRRSLSSVTFPSGANLDSGDPDSNLCMFCHQGRRSTSSVNNHIVAAGVGDDQVSTDLVLANVNPHYLAAAATLFGTQAQGAYEYSGKAYQGRAAHSGMDTCRECHNTHEQTVRITDCAASGCHPGVSNLADLRSIRTSSSDFDGDGNNSEGLAEEISTLQDALFDSIQDYALNTAGQAIAYTAAAYPYFFIDTNGNGIADPDEADPGNAYNHWTPRLLRAAYNYLWTQEDPGVYSHNGLYTLQFLYDSLEDMGTNMSGKVRP